MSVLIKCENLAKQAIFSSNKENILRAIGLIETFKAQNNQKIRIALSNGSEQFADMTRIVK
ncbi:MAG: hypothetical protein Q8M03_07725 [Legionella sp.]|nr:hypothetical protein [Legionella sp.]